jgi:hypothetical protein
MGILELLMIILVIAWLLGMVALPVGTSAIHLLLVVVLVLLIVKLMRGQRVV